MVKLAITYAGHSKSIAINGLTTRDCVSTIGVDRHYGRMNCRTAISVIGHIPRPSDRVTPPIIVVLSKLPAHLLRDHKAQAGYCNSAYHLHFRLPSVAVLQMGNRSHH